MIWQVTSITLLRICTDAKIYVNSDKPIDNANMTKRRKGKIRKGLSTNEIERFYLKML